MLNDINAELIEYGRGQAGPLYMTNELADDAWIAWGPHVRHYRNGMSATVFQLRLQQLGEFNFFVYQVAEIVFGHRIAWPPGT